MYYTLENFIDYCDDIQIVNESYKDMKREIDKYFVEIESINKKIDDESKLKSIISLIKQRDAIVTKFQNELMSMEYSTGDKVINTFTTCADIINNIHLNALFYIPAGMVIFDKVTDNKKFVGKITGHALIGSIAYVCILNLKKRKNIKQNTLRLMDELHKTNNLYIKAFNTMLSRGITTKDDMLKNNYKIRVNADNLSYEIIQTYH